MRLMLPSSPRPVGVAGRPPAGTGADSQPIAAGPRRRWGTLPSRWIPV